MRRGGKPPLPEMHAPVLYIASVMSVVYAP